MKKTVRFTAFLCVVVMLCSVLASCDANGEQLTGTVTGIPNLDNFERFYIKLSNIDGQSYDSRHNKWIDVLDFDFGSEAGDVAAGKPADFKDFTFVHLVDKATPRLQSYCMKGSPIPSVEFHYCRAVAGKQEVVFAIKLDNAYIISAEGGVLDDGRVIETVKMSCEKTTWTVASFNIDNTPAGTDEEYFNKRNNK